MIPIRFLVPILLILSGCAGPEARFGPAGWPWPFTHPEKSGVTTSRGAGSGGYAQFSFDWQLAGAPEIMPVQVFDDGAFMWLQFHPEGAWPAVFDASAAGWRPLSYRSEPPYMVLEGVYEHLELRGGHLRGSIRRVGTAAPAQADVTEHGLQHAAISEQVSDFGKEASPVVAPSTGVESGLPSPGDTVHPDWLAAPGTQAPSAALAAVSDTAPGYLGTPVNRYAVSPADHTIRQALRRWASAAGWTFSAEHWAVDVDIPLVGEASFETDFKSAVRELLAATEMGDRPLQPCFYSNRVLRVVPYAQPCDRRAGRGAAS